MRPDIRAEYPDNLDPEFGNYIAGLTDGEGCFTIDHKPKQGAYACRFTLALRDDDRPILESIQTVLGVGTIYGRTTAANPLSVWRIGRREECEVFAEVLRRHPLRAKKAKDFRSRTHNWKLMARLKVQLEEGRRYPVEEAA